MSTSRKDVVLFDTTLRDGEQTVGVVFDPKTKLAIARKLDELGVRRIEAGFPKVSAEDAEALRDILAAGLKAEVWGFARATKDDVDVLLQLKAPAAVIEVPTSDIKLKAYGLTRDEVVRRATTAIRHAADHGLKVAFFAVDGTRTDLEFLKKINLAALEAINADREVPIKIRQSKYLNNLVEQDHRAHQAPGQARHRFLFLRNSLANIPGV